ncbi:protein unc-13 homolog D-like [Mya arenaria]|uniref:protein unc-13 homolog D-like n=1 Tax=Mya arenaria TaxID=6604 RepID=UPI0022DFB264|nr:protein unc-13 homolog D-like [Mya arenaria]
MRNAARDRRIESRPVELQSESRSVVRQSESRPVNCYTCRYLDVINIFGQHENVYRCLVRALLHPLGAQETISGLRHEDLLDYLKEVFDVDPATHELIIMEEKPNRPTQRQANVTVLEANGLIEEDLSKDTFNLYCLVMNQPARRKSTSSGSSPRALSPKQSRKMSPRNSQGNSASSSPIGSPVAPRNESTGLSPLLSRKGVYFIEPETARTSTVKNSSHPKWNEEFELDIENFRKDQLHVYVCDEEGSLETKPEKNKRHKQFMSILRHSDEHDNIISDRCLGKIRIPVRDISTLGTDDWFDIVSDVPCKGKPRVEGKCHLRLSISYKQAAEGGCHQPNEDYLQIYRQCLKHTYSTSRQNHSRHVGDRYGCLCLKDHRILQVFAEAHRISKLSQSLSKLICLLEVQCEDELIYSGDVDLLYSLYDFQMTWDAMQIAQQNVLDRMPLTDMELSNYQRVASCYIELKSSKVDELPALFPPAIETINVLKTKLGVVVMLLDLELWEASCDGKAHISDRITKTIQARISDWIKDQMAEFEETKITVKDKMNYVIEKLIDFVNKASSHCIVIPVLQQFFNCIGVNYFRLVSLALDKTISPESMKITEKINRYKKRNANFPENIKMASKMSLRLYFSLKNLRGVISGCVSMRDSSLLGLTHYQMWFEESMTYWLHTFRTECVQRMEKAVEIDKDVVVVTSLAKYSHSSVDVLSCFSQVIGEWMNIGIHEPDCALMGMINITDIISDCARQYAEKIQLIIERNCYFDNIPKAEFNINDKLCITLNNIDHVRLYLSELPELLAWDTVIMRISTHHNNAAVGKQALGTLQRLIDTTNDEISSKCKSLLRQICEKMKVGIDRFIELFMRKNSVRTTDNLQSLDNLLCYISANLQTLEDQLMPNMFQYIIEQLWSVVVSSFCAQIQPGHLRSMMSCLGRCGLDDHQLLNPECQALQDILDSNAKHSDTLMLEYYEGLSSDVMTPTVNCGYLSYTASYVEETRESISIIVTVFQCSNLPGLNPTGYSDPYVEVSLQPQKLFRLSRPQRTHVIKQSLNPVFNVNFQFPNVSKEVLKQPGNCILLSVFDHDYIGRDDFVGEVVVHLPTVIKMGMDESMDIMPVVIMPLKRPTKPTSGPYEVRQAKYRGKPTSGPYEVRQAKYRGKPTSGPYVILSLRKWDKEAEKFITRRNRVVFRQNQRTDSVQYGGGIFSRVFSLLKD